MKPKISLQVESIIHQTPPLAKGSSYQYYKRMYTLFWLTTMPRKLSRQQEMIRRQYRIRPRRTYGQPIFAT
jgi:hypothetical protein